MKSIITLFLIFTTLYSRENPFVPIILPEDSLRPQYENVGVFNEQEIRLPSTARLIKQIEITYQNIDGSIAKQSVDVSGRIDWNMPLKISQTLQTKEKQLVKDNIRVNGNTLEVQYKGKLVRDFIMKNPDRIILDFEKNNKLHNHKMVNLNTPYFTSVRFGVHDHFIRVVVQLSGSYEYALKGTPDGIVIDVK